MRDSDVREAILHRLNYQHADDKETRIVQEMGIWSSTVRIDVAVINGIIHGYELKSERDTLYRLPQQVKYYSDIFDRMTLVVAEKHIDAARKIVPDWWGITSARQEKKTGKVILTSAIEAKENPSVNPLQLARILWRDEALSILKKYEFDRGVRSKPIAQIAQRLASSLPLETLQAEVRLVLKNRQPGYSGEIVSDKTQMPINRNADPSGAVPWRRRALSYLLNTLIRPTIR